jgi:hypothetical protein
LEHRADGKGRVRRCPAARFTAASARMVHYPRRKHKIVRWDPDRSRRRPSGTGSRRFPAGRKSPSSQRKLGSKFVSLDLWGDSMFVNMDTSFRWDDDRGGNDRSAPLTSRLRVKSVRCTSPRT